MAWRRISRWPTPAGKTYLEKGVLNELGERGVVCRSPCGWRHYLRSAAYVAAAAGERVSGNVIFGRRNVVSESIPRRILASVVADDVGMYI